MNLFLEKEENKNIFPLSDETDTCSSLEKRIGEKMKLKKAAAVLLTASLAFSLSVTPVLADNVNDLKEQKQAAEDEVSSLQSQLNTLMTKITELENDLITTGEEITQTEADLQTAQDDEQKQYEDMKLRIKYMYEAGSGSAAVEKVMTTGSISGMLTQAEYSQQVHTYDRQKLKEYAETVQKVKDLQDTLETKMDDLKKTQTEFEAQQDELNTTITEKSAEVANLDDQLQAAIKKAAEEEAARQKAAEEAAAKKAAQQSSSTSNKNTSGSTGSSTTKTESNTVNNNTSKPSTSTPSVSTPPASTPSEDNSASDTPVYTPDYNQSAADIIVSAAWSQVGKATYVWGTQIPYVSFDCSGLVQWCYAQAGISIPRQSTSIKNSGTIVSDPRPGDICWTPGHVAIYIGNGQMIEAQQDGVPICVSKVRATYYIRY